jgi:hypothetical protein
MGDISKNFDFSEFVVSASYPQLAAQINLTHADKVKIHWLTHIVLQPLRDFINEGLLTDEPLKVSINSGIRDVVLNSAVDGVSHSDHLYRKMSCASDIELGGNTSKYWEHAYTYCYSVRRFIKQFIYYLPYTDGQGRSRGNFIHVSTRDHTDKVWDVLYCASRGAREYFCTIEDAESYMRTASG